MSEGVYLGGDYRLPDAESTEKRKPPIPVFSQRKPISDPEPLVEVPEAPPPPSEYDV